MYHNKDPFPFFTFLFLFAHLSQLGIPTISSKTAVLNSPLPRRVSSGNAAVMGNVTDTENKAIYEMHQYLDSDSSGTSDVCVSSTIGSERLEVATEWLRSNGKLGFLGEYAGGSNSVCEEAVEDLLQYLVDNNDVWLGAVSWQ